jgi:hypothetical protein
MFAVVLALMSVTLTPLSMAPTTHCYLAFQVAGVMEQDANSAAPSQPPATRAGSSTPPCLNDVKSEMRRLLRLAGECGGSHDAIEAIESSEAGTDGRRREIAMECANTYGSLGEHEEVPQHCPLLLMCTALSFRYAIDTIDSYDGDCTTAVEAGLNEIFAPKQER